MDTCAECGKELSDSEEPMTVFNVQTNSANHWHRVYWGLAPRLRYAS